jgi:hypothetical protein
MNNSVFQFVALAISPAQSARGATKVSPIREGWVSARDMQSAAGSTLRSPGVNR